MNRHIKYSKSYRRAIAYFVTAIALTILLFIAAFTMSRSTEVMTALFFASTVVAVLFFLSIYYWWRGEYLRFGDLWNA